MDNNNAKQTHTEDGALVELPDNVLILHRNLPYTYLLHNTLTRTINNMILTYGENEVMEALEFHYKMKKVG